VHLERIYMKDWDLIGEASTAELNTASMNRLHSRPPLLASQSREAHARAAIPLSTSSPIPRHHDLYEFIPHVVNDHRSSNSFYHQHNLGTTLKAMIEFEAAFTICASIIIVIARRFRVTLIIATVPDVTLVQPCRSLAHPCQSAPRKHAVSPQTCMLRATVSMAYLTVDPHQI